MTDHVVVHECGNCRFWNRNGEPREFWDPDADEGFGASIPTEHRRCLRVLHANGSNENDRKSATDGAVVVDGSGYSASLLTLPTFGCFMYEPQPNEAGGGKRSLHEELDAVLLDARAGNSRGALRSFGRRLCRKPRIER